MMRPSASAHVQRRPGARRQLAQAQATKASTPSFSEAGGDLRQFQPDDLFIGAADQFGPGRQAAEEMIEMRVGESQAAIAHRTW